MPLAPADAPETVARVKEGMRLVEQLAHQMQRDLAWSNYDDLRSAGHEGLLHAARAFDPSLGVPFRRYATLRVRGAILDSLRSQVGLPRRVYERLRAIEAGDRVSEAAIEDETQKPHENAEHADAHLTDYLASVATAMAMGLLAKPVKGEALDTKDAVDDQVARAEIMAKITEVIEAQPEAEKHLLKRHYFDGVEFHVAATELGLSKSWASRLHARAIEGVTRELKRRRIA
jgi:RNA polymerase sigma factor for flagellar operon FliA